MHIDENANWDFINITIIIKNVSTPIQMELVNLYAWNILYEHWASVTYKIETTAVCSVRGVGKPERIL